MGKGEGGGLVGGVDWMYSMFLWMNKRNVVSCIRISTVCWKQWNAFNAIFVVVLTRLDTILLFHELFRLELCDDLYRIAFNGAYCIYNPCLDKDMCMVSLLDSFAVHLAHSRPPNWAILCFNLPWRCLCSLLFICCEHLNFDMFYLLSSAVMVCRGQGILDFKMFDIYWCLSTLVILLSVYWALTILSVSLSLDTIMIFSQGPQYSGILWYSV